MEINELIKIITKALALQEGAINEDSSSDNIMEWDSLGQLSILNAINNHLNGEYDLTDLTDILNVNEMLTIINEKIKV